MISSGAVNIDLKHSETNCRHLVDCFINMNNWAIMMRGFRYRVIESSTNWLASCNLLADGVYMEYMKITKQIREETKFRREKPHVFQCSFLTRELRACARGSCRYDVENGTDSFWRVIIIPLLLRIVVGWKKKPMIIFKEFVFFRFSFNKRRQWLAGVRGFTLN